MLSPPDSISDRYAQRAHILFLDGLYWFERRKETLTTNGERPPKELKANSTAQTIFLKGHLPILAIVL
jgi:hypothetical protein